jgi:hypothetical protein
MYEEANFGGKVGNESVFVFYYYPSNHEMSGNYVLERRA